LLKAWQGLSLRVFEPEAESIHAVHGITGFVPVIPM
jgi:hypothetical protein